LKTSLGTETGKYISLVYYSRWCNPEYTNKFPFLRFLENEVAILHIWIVDLWKKNMVNE